MKWFKTENNQIIDLENFKNFWIENRVNTYLVMGKDKDDTIWELNEYDNLIDAEEYITLINSVLIDEDLPCEGEDDGDDADSLRKHIELQRLFMDFCIKNDLQEDFMLRFLVFTLKSHFQVCKLTPEEIKDICENFVEPLDQTKK